MGAPLRVATAGSVDDGKSTLVGRLLYDTKTLLADQLDAATDASRTRGLADTDLSLVVDGLRAEREQGITIDVAYRYFASGRRAFVLADTPGHEQYTRNMVTGASTADVVVVLVDASKGMTAQSRRHIAVAALLRVPHVVFAINKMDLVGYAEPVFDDVARELSALAEALGIATTTPIPLVALHGDNVTGPSGRIPWYQGPSVLEHLETVRVPEPPPCGLRLPVQYVLRAPHGHRTFAGRVVAGSVLVGQEVVALPSGATSRVVGIDGPDGGLDGASRGESVAVRLADHLDIARGDLLAVDPPAGGRTAHLVVCWLAAEPIRAGARLLVRHGTRETAARVGPVGGRLDLTRCEYTDADELALNDLGRLVLTLAEPLWADPYRHSRGSGAVLLLDPQDGETLGAGMVEVVAP